MLARNQHYPLKEILETYIQLIRKAGNKPFQLSEDFFLYGQGKELHSEQSYFLGDYPDVDEDKWVDVYPPPVQGKGLDAICSGDVIIEVISSVLGQKPKASLEEYVNAINYYLNYDAFLNFS